MANKISFLTKITQQGKLINNIIDVKEAIENTKCANIKFRISAESGSVKEILSKYNFLKEYAILSLIHI